MEQLEQRRAKINNFYETTLKHFQFLEKYNYIPQNPAFQDDARDTEAMIRYVGPAVVVEIYWNLTVSYIGITFLERREERYLDSSEELGKQSEPGKATSLNAIVQLRSDNGESEFLLD